MTNDVNKFVGDSVRLSPIVIAGFRINCTAVRKPRTWCIYFGSYHECFVFIIIKKYYSLIFEDQMIEGNVMISCFKTIFSPSKRDNKNIYYGYLLKMVISSGDCPIVPTQVDKVAR